jgi:hypothetical protein
MLVEVCLMVDAQGIYAVGLSKHPPSFISLLFIKRVRIFNPNPNPELYE